MVLYTGGNRLEVELTRHVVFFRLPFIGEVCWTRTFGCQYFPWREVTAQLQVQAAR
jgi:hypothetical protein